MLVEAQSQALACLSTHVGGVAELVRTERTGVLVAPDDPEALAAALLRLIRDPDTRARLGKAGAKRVAAHFDAQASLTALSDLFDTLQPIDPAAIPADTKTVGAKAHPEKAGLAVRP